jgi:protein-L-isoaspartate(D-aspartate) O-methyltransferase
MSDFSTLRVMMVDTQVRPSDVTKFPIIEAMLSVPREAYVPDAKRAVAYIGENIALGAGRVLMEARTLAKTLDALDILPTDRVLDIGCGLGYSAAVLARMAGSVTALEVDADMAATAAATLAAHAVTNAKVSTGALEKGATEVGPFDVIVIEGGVAEVSETLLAQLAEGGRISAVFMDGPLGVVKVGHKADGRVSWRFAFNATAPILPGFAKAAAFAL